MHRNPFGSRAAALGASAVMLSIISSLSSSSLALAQASDAVTHQDEAGGAKAREVRAREVKSWPAHGAWSTTLIERPTGGYMCMLNGLGNNPHSFGVSIIEMPGHLMFAVDDRASKEGYMPTMTVKIDNQQGISFNTFNDPPMTSTAPDEAQKVRVLIDRLTRGKSLTVDARRAQYTLSLGGFANAAAQLVACNNEMASLQNGTVGHPLRP